MSEVSDAEAMLGAATLWELVVRRAEATPDARVLFDESDHALTFTGLRAAAERRAAALRAIGVDRGVVVSWQLPTRIDTIVTLLALSRLGAVQNPILHLYREREVRFAMAQLRPAIVLTPESWGGFEYGAMARALADELSLSPQIVDPASLP